MGHYFLDILYLRLEDPDDLAVHILDEVAAGRTLNVCK